MFLYLKAGSKTQVQIIAVANKAPQCSSVLSQLVGQVKTTEPGACYVGRSGQEANDLLQFVNQANRQCNPN